MPELGSVEFGHHLLQNLIKNGRQDTLFLILSQLLAEDWQVGGQRP